MVILSLFALLAGAGTAVSPCVLPILPALLSAGAVGGRRRPLGIVVGLALTFWLTVVGFASAVGSSGLGHSALRTLAIVVLAGFGAVLLAPALAARLEAPLSRLTRLGPRTRGDGFWSGLGVGGALGFVYLPCAGPILAAVIAVSASNGLSLRTVVIAAAYALGSAVVLLGLTLGGRRLLARVRRRASGPALGRAVAVIMLLTAAVMVAGLDDRLRTALAGTTLGDPAQSLESSHAVASRLASLGGRARFSEPSAAAAASTDPTGIPGVPTPDLTVLGPAPDFTGNQRWFNTPGGGPLNLAALRGRVVLVDFWTYTCINCLRTLPYLTAWDQRYRDSGLTVVGVHTPEFDFEHDAGNVAAAVRDHGIHYPVAQDNNYATWNAWGNQYWPAEYLVDAVGNVRHVSLGEGDYASSEAAIRALLTQAGHTSLPAPVHVSAITPSDATRTPETYLDPARGKGWTPPLTAGRRTYPGSAGTDPGTSRFALGGSWLVRKEGSVGGRDARIDAGVAARRTYLVLGPPPGGKGHVQVELDGRPVGPGSAGSDAPGGTVTVDSQRLYELVDLPAVQRRHLTVRLSPGTAAYSFTFG